MDRDTWTFEFLDELAREIEPPLPVKFARALALSKWSTDGHREPALVAHEWLKHRPAPTKAEGFGNDLMKSIQSLRQGACRQKAAET